jgi:hypothetical protein
MQREISVQAALEAAQAHADKHGVHVAVLLVSPTTHAHQQQTGPSRPVPIPPPPGLQLDGPRAVPDRPVARARHAKGSGNGAAGKIRHEVPGRNIMEFEFEHKQKRYTLTLADVTTPQGVKTSAYVGTAYICDFAVTPAGAACILRHPGKGKRVTTSEPVPPEFSEYCCRDYREASGYSGSGVPDNVWAVVAPPGDSASIASVALRRWLARHAQ